MAFNIVLVEPEIPQNTGNIIRTAAATGSALHLVKPLGFETTDKHFKRAGLDYFDKTQLFYYDCIEDVLARAKGHKLHFATTKAKMGYADATYTGNDFFFFGKESQGLSELLLEKHYDDTIRIPMLSGIRSLNLSNSVAVVVYEALRQTGFKQMQLVGELTGRGY